MSSMYAEVPNLASCSFRRRGRAPTKLCTIDMGWHSGMPSTENGKQDMLQSVGTESGYGKCSRNK